MRLEIDDSELASCVSCGLCLPHCPTWRVTGDEAASPRGRIAAMREVQAGAPPGEAFVAVIDSCVQCRGCETACPSGVPFGHLMEGTRATLAATRPGYPKWWQRSAYRVLGRHRALLALSTVGALVQRVGLVPARLETRLGLPARLPIRRTRLRPSGNDAWLFTGCVMDAWQRPVHAAAKRLLERTGAGVALPGPGASCCGALHVHAGLADDARKLAGRVMAAFPGEAPIVVDSAGCGAALKDYGRLVGTPEAAAFSARVRDIHEHLALCGMSIPETSRIRVAVQDPCHLRHVQRAHEHVRTVLAPVAEIVELDDDGLCCGAGGAYAALQPELAGAIRDRKVDAIVRTGATVVASANPGCALYLAPALAARGIVVRHPVEIVEEALGGR